MAAATIGEQRRRWLVCRSEDGAPVDPVSLNIGAARVIVRRLI
jgi:hypothetical protein